MANHAQRLVIALLCLMAWNIYVDAFIPNVIKSVLSPFDRTHMKITEHAQRRMAVFFMNDYPDIYPDQDKAMSTTDFHTALTQFREGSAAPDENRLKNVKHVHVDSETFVEAGKRLKKEKENVITAIEADDIALARDLAGQLLHTLQDFYSHSNWVEMIGDNINPTWGIDDKVTGTVAPTTQHTCTNCLPTTPPICIGNIIPTLTLLTSGYVKIGLSLNLTAYKPYPGKCSHGGIFDLTTPFIPPIGGINKDSKSALLSPHWYLHLQAAELAQQDTFNWFKLLRDSVSDDRYAQFLGLQFASSLCFVVDTTGSMQDEIDAVKLQTTIMTSGADVDKISDYVLGEFNDPEFGPAWRTTDPDIMLILIDGLTATGGGDEPEMAYNGIDAALDFVRDGSTCYVFTDAPAKDVAIKGMVEARATKKNVELIVLYTGSGSFPGKRDIESVTHRERRTTVTDPLSETALVSGGMRIQIPKHEIGEGVALVATTLSTLKVTILQVDFVSEDLFIPIPIDETLRDVTIIISTNGFFQLTDTFIDATENLMYPSLIISTSTLRVYSIPDPSDGMWYLDVGVDVAHGGIYSVRVIANSIVDFIYSFVEEHLEGHPGYLKMEGKPLATEESIIVADVFGSFHPITRDRMVPGLADVTELAIVEIDGTEVQRHSLFELEALKRYEVRTVLPSTAFRVVFEGRDTRGNIVQRWHTPLRTTAESVLYVVLGVEGLLRIKPGETLDVSLSVTNLGDRATYNLDVFDSLDFFVSITLSTLTLDVGESRTVVMTFAAPVDAESGQITTVSATSVRTSDDDENFIVFYISVESLTDDKTPPACTILSTDGKCSLTSRGGNCKDETWSINFSIQDSGTGLHLVKPSIVHPGAALDISFIQNTTDMVTGSYTSDCCMPRVAIVATDGLGNSDRRGLCTVDYIPVVTGGVCEMSESGSVTTFDGASGFPDLELPSRNKSLVSKTIVPDSNLCKYQVRAVTNKAGNIVWLAISVGIHPNLDKHKVNFAFDRVSGKAEIRGHGFAGPEVLSLPTSWAQGTLRIDISGDSTGWRLSSSPCSYRLYFGPDGPEPVFRLTVGNELKGKVEGICGDFNDDPDNDHA